MPALEHISRSATSGFDMFEREQRDGLPELHRDVLGDAQRKRRLSHRRTGREDDQVRALETRRDAVEIAESGRDAGDPSGALAGGELRDAHEASASSSRDRGEVLAVACRARSNRPARRLVDEVLDLAGRSSRAARSARRPGSGRATSRSTRTIRA